MKISADLSAYYGCRGIGVVTAMMKYLISYSAINGLRMGMIELYLTEMANPLLFPIQYPMRNTDPPATYVLFYIIIK